MQQQQYAVIQTGSIMPSGVLVTFTAKDGSQAPAVLYVNADKAKVERMKKRYQNKAKRHGTIAMAGVGTFVSSMPILGVCEIVVHVPERKAVASAPSANGEHKGRGRGRKAAHAEPQAA